VGFVTDLEIIRAELVEKVSGGAWRWRAMFGQPHVGISRLRHFGLCVGDEVVIEVAKARRGWELRRVVQVPPTATAVDRRVDEDLPAAMEPAAPALQIGDLVLARVRFTKSDGTGRASKLRPCVVMEIGSLEVVVRPVYGSGSSMAKTGGCRRLLHWRDAGLHKPSCVGAEDIYLPVSPAPRRTGTLHPEDVQRLIDENR